MASSGNPNGYSGIGEVAGGMRGTATKDQTLPGAILVRVHDMVTEEPDAASSLPPPAATPASRPEFQRCVCPDPTVATPLDTDNASTTTSPATVETETEAGEVSTPSFEATVPVLATLK